MEVSIDREDIEEIESKLSELTHWLTGHFVNIGAVALVLDAVIKRVEEVKEKLDETED